MLTSMVRTNLTINIFCIEVEDNDDSIFSVFIAGSYQGLLLQARKKGTTTMVGTFSGVPINTKLMKCDNTDDTVTHSNANDKTGFFVTWVTNSNRGDIEFV